MFSKVSLWLAVFKRRKDVRKNLEAIKVTLEELCPNKDAWMIDEWLEDDPSSLKAAYPSGLKANLYLIVRSRDNRKEIIGFVGSFRQKYDEESEKTPCQELSIYINPKIRRQGAALEAIKLFINLTQPEILMATTEASNIPCQRLLEKSGFIRAEPDERPGFIEYCYVSLHPKSP